MLLNYKIVPSVVDFAFSPAECAIIIFPLTKTQEKGLRNMLPKTHAELDMGRTLNG